MVGGEDDATQREEEGAMREGAGGGKEEGNGTGATRSPKGPLDVQNAIEAIEARCGPVGRSSEKGGGSRRDTRLVSAERESRR